ncbi:MAG: tail fiber protein [Thermoanaerobaculia bacterium]|nr:tail fiber protein [Thermoanaerobaculia bacterium]
MDSFVGQIAIFPFSFAPTGWLLCAGQLLPISQYPALFSLIGDSFGGDGRTNFAVPNYQNQAPKGSQYYICLQGNFPPR